MVDYNENMLKEKVAKKAARTRRSSAKKGTETAEVVKEAPVVADKSSEAAE